MRRHVKTLLAEILQSFDHVEVFSAHTETETAGVQGAVAHEVADELSELDRNILRDLQIVLGGPAVPVGKARKRDMLRLANELVQRQRNAIAGAQVGKAPPRPRAVTIDDLDAMLRCTSELVAALGDHVHDALDSVDVEARRVTGPVVGLHAGGKRLPLVSERVTQRSKADESMTGRDERATDKATSRCEH